MPASLRGHVAASHCWPFTAALGLIMLLGRLVAVALVVEALGSRQLAAAAAAAKTPTGSAPEAHGFIEAFLGEVAAGSTLPVALKICPLVPAAEVPGGPQECNATGTWTYSRYSTAVRYPFVEDGQGQLHVTSNYSGDPWINAHGSVRVAPSPPSIAPAYCPGGLVPLRPLAAVDVTLHFNCTKDGTIITHTGVFDAGCSSITMDDGGVYTRVSAAGPSKEKDTGDACVTARLALRVEPTAAAVDPPSRPNWTSLSVAYDVFRPDADGVGGGVLGAEDSFLRIDVVVEADPSNLTVRYPLHCRLSVTLPCRAECLGYNTLVTPHHPSPAGYP